MPNDYAEIRLNEGKVAIIDREDLEMIAKYNWNAQCRRHTCYAYTAIGRAVVGMHRYIMGARRGQVVDHINGDGLDNRRSNLRFATASQNRMNSSKSRSQSTTSIYKGVYYEKGGKRKKRWRGRIDIGGKKTHLGRFLTEAEAAKAYDNAAREHFGEFAKLNF
jgi:hypothetical protein